MPTVLNDVHSALNPTPVARIMKPSSLQELVALVKEASTSKAQISVAGGRHAMGGQQFARDQWHLDMTGLNKVLKTDAQRGLLQMEAGAYWPQVIAASHAIPRTEGGQWAIAQKQTGVDEVTLGGSIAANAHGRGLLMQPMASDIEEITLVDPRGEVLVCSRTHRKELFSLVMGGYGLFGVVYSATLRLVPRQRVRRVVDVLDLADAMNAVYRRVNDGCVYGDFQFVIDPLDEAFLHRGVFACYKPVPNELNLPDDSSESADLNPQAWLQLLKLAHENKSQAFTLYAQHYLGTHGKTYWADTMQLSTYIPSYAEYLEKSSKQQTSSESHQIQPKTTLMIGEHYVPRNSIAKFLELAVGILKNHQVEVIYGTIRAILKDDTSFIPWAKEDYACVIFNINTPHTVQGQNKTAQAFRDLIDAALQLRGSYFLTYHRHATQAQVLAAYPQFNQFLAKKRQYDPQELFTSDWYAHHVALMASPSCA